MFFVNHEGDTIGTSALESGDPEQLSVSGVITNMGGAKALAAWMKSIGAQEEDGATFIALNKDFTLVGSEGEEIAFSEGTLIAVPETEETFVELLGISDEDYAKHFPKHIESVSN